MKVFVTGANGLLGQHLVKQLIENNFLVIATGKGPCRLPFQTPGNFHYYSADITNDQAVHDILSIEQPDVVVHAAAMTQVDDCEQHQDSCFEVNVQATAQLLLAAEAFSGFFLFVSTDFVFDGEQGNYKEEDPLNPVSWYGFTKVQAESTVETSAIPWAIVRTCLVYGNVFSGTRNNIVTWVRSNLEQGKEIKVVHDQVRTPTYVEDLAKGIVLVIFKRATGIFHLSGKDILTPYEMAILTADYFNLNKNLVTKVDASVFRQPARRPPRTGFDISKATKELGFEPLSFAEALKKMGGSYEL